MSSKYSLQGNEKPPFQNEDWECLEVNRTDENTYEELWINRQTQEQEIVERIY